MADSQVLGDLLDQIPSDERIDSVYTDGAYDTKRCRQVIADRNANAIIPPRKNAKLWKDKRVSSIERNTLLDTVKRLGRTIWKKWSGCYRRSLVETKMHCIKLLGHKLSVRNFESQVNEVHARIAVLNKFTELVDHIPKLRLKFSKPKKNWPFLCLCNKAVFDIRFDYFYFFHY